MSKGVRWHMDYNNGVYEIKKCKVCNAPLFYSVISNSYYCTKCKGGQNE